MKVYIANVGWEQSFDGNWYPAVEVFSHSPSWYARVYAHPSEGWQVIYLAYGVGRHAKRWEGDEAETQFESLFGEVDWDVALTPVARDLYRLGEIRAHRRWAGGSLNV